jgi:hypothetical protein
MAVLIALPATWGNQRSADAKICATRQSGHLLTFGVVIDDVETGRFVIRDLPLALYHCIRGRRDSSPYGLITELCKTSSRQQPSNNDPPCPVLIHGPKSGSFDLPPLLEVSPHCWRSDTRQFRAFASDGAVGWRGIRNVPGATQCVSVLGHHTGPRIFVPSLRTYRTS